MEGAQLCVIANLKGGVGKSTVCVHLAAALAEQGRRVLVLDLDPTAGATSHLGLRRDRVGSFELLTGERPAHELVQPAELAPGVDVIPASRALDRLERVLARRSEGPAFGEPWECLRDHRAALRELGHELILIDTAPSQCLATDAAYLAADVVLTPVVPSLPSAYGLSYVLGAIAAAHARPHLNPRLRFLGAVLCAADPRTLVGREFRGSYAELLAERGLADALCRTELPAATAYVQAWRQRRPLFAHAPRHPALGHVRALAAEFLERLKGAAAAAVN